MFFKEVIVILSYMYCFWRNTPTYLPIIIDIAAEITFMIVSFEP